LSSTKVELFQGYFNNTPMLLIFKQHRCIIKVIYKKSHRISQKLISTIFYDHFLYESIHLSKGDTPFMGTTTTG